MLAATLEGNVDQVRALLAAGADKNERDGVSWNRVMAAMMDSLTERFNKNLYDSIKHTVVGK